VSDSAIEHPTSTDSLPIRRWLAAAALLIVEYVFALFVFDAERMPIAGETGLFHLLGQSMPLVIVVTTAMLLLGNGLSKAEMADIAAAFHQPRRTWPLLVGHLLAYALAICITVFVFNPGRQLERPWLWVTAWALSAVASLVLLVAAVVPRVAVRPIAKAIVRALSVGFLVGILALLAGSLTSVLWYPMSRLTLEVVAFLLNLTGHAVVTVPDELIVGTPAYKVFVARQCSGYEGIGLITVMLSFYLFLFRKSLRFPNALLLLPIGIVLIWLANSLRIAALIVVGTWVTPRIAEGGFHSAAGWLLFCAITLGLVAVSRRWGWFARDVAAKEITYRTPEGAYLLPLLVLIATGLLTALFTTGFDYLYPVRVLTPLIPLWLFRSFYADLRWSWSWTPIVLGFVVFILWVALEPPPDPERVAVIPSALGAMPRGAAALWLIARVFGSVIVVPIVEELAFRGYLLRRLIDSDFTTVSPKQFTMTSFVVSSVAFGMVHGHWFAGVLAGMIYAAAQYRRGKISDAIVAHVVTNALIAAYVLGFGEWNFW
jgi:exosortase E/protease (VPEID-CTERM system)